MPAKQKTTISDEVLQAYDKMIAGLKGIERKGATMPYTSLNGHMFSFLDANGTLSLRLPKESIALFIAAHKTTLSEQHGRILKEYVIVPDKLFKNTAAMKACFKESYDYIRTLKPKK